MLKGNISGMSRLHLNHLVELVCSKYKIILLFLTISEWLPCTVWHLQLRSLGDTSDIFASMCKLSWINYRMWNAKDIPGVGKFHVACSVLPRSSININRWMEYLLMLFYGYFVSEVVTWQCDFFSQFRYLNIVYNLVYIYKVKYT